MKIWYSRNTSSLMPWLSSLGSLTAIRVCSTSCWPGRIPAPYQSPTAVTAPGVNITMDSGGSVESVSVSISNVSWKTGNGWMQSAVVQNRNPYSATMWISGHYLHDTCIFYIAGTISFKTNSIFHFLFKLKLMKTTSWLSLQILSSHKISTAGACLRFETRTSWSHLKNHQDNY